MSVVTNIVKKPTAGSVCSLVMDGFAVHSKPSFCRQTNDLILVAATHASKVVCAVSARLSTTIIIPLKTARWGITPLTCSISSVLVWSARAEDF